MVSEQKVKQRIRYENTKYGRKNWAPGEQELVMPARQTMKITRRAFLLVIVAMLGLVCVVVSSAYMAQIRYQINSIHKENANVLGNIEMMKLDLEKDRSINKLEERAIAELGMKYPDPSEIIFLEPPEKVQEGAEVAQN